MLLGRVVFPGDIPAPPPWPPRVWQLRHGLVLNWHVRVGAFSLVHIDSADFLTEELRGLRADVVCLCAAGWRARPRYIRDVVAALRPTWIVPCHWDTMITPLHDPPQRIPGIDLERMLREIRAAGVEPLLMPMLARLLF